MKMISRVLMTAVAVAALAAPAMAADKLLVQDATGTNTVFKVDDTGLVLGAKLGLGTTAPEATIHNVETGTNPARGLMIAQHNDGAQGASFIVRKSRGTNVAPTVTASGDYLGGFVGQYWNGSAYDRSVMFAFRNDATITDTTRLPTGVIFYTGSSTQGADPNILAERFRISSQGNIVAGNNGGSASGTLALTATDGFIYIPSTAGLVTSCATVTTYTGHVPIWYDTTSNKLCTCNSGVRKCAPSAFN